jgi:hypothetical protein
VNFAVRSDSGAATSGILVDKGKVSKALRDF